MLIETETEGSRGDVILAEAQPPSHKLIAGIKNIMSTLNAIHSSVALTLFHPQAAVKFQY